MEIISLVISIISLVLSIILAIHSIYVYNKTVDHDKKKSTLDAFNLLQEQVLDKLNLYSIKEIKKISEDPHSEIYKEISGLLARIEHFSVGVNSKIYDIETLKRLAEKYFYALYDKLLPIITKKRKINTSDKHYDEFEKLIKNIKGLYKNT